MRCPPHPQARRAHAEAAAATPTDDDVAAFQPDVKPGSVKSAPKHTAQPAPKHTIQPTVTRPTSPAGAQADEDKLARLKSYVHKCGIRRVWYVRPPL